MSDLILPPPTLLPLPSVPITIRPGTMDDIAFMDALQKKTTKQVGWMPTKQFEGKIAAGHVLVAECADNEPRASASGRGEAASTPLPYGRGSLRAPLGYLVGNDQYFKRDDVGIIYQINVVPEYRRSLVAASLLKAQFERSAYGCKLYCCWCAQDIEANRFWEAMGFVALAYRVGSMTKGSGVGVQGSGTAASLPNPKPRTLNPRIHIFWQKRIRANDTTTPWWFPSKTDGGAIRADRIVLPIPPEVRWSDDMPILLPGSEERREPALSVADGLREESGAQKKRSWGKRTNGVAPPEPRKRRTLVQFGPPGSSQPVIEPEPVEAPKVREKRPKPKADPRLVSAARELRDRWIEEVSAGRLQINAPGGKYQLTRPIEHRPVTLALPHAA